MGKITTLLIGVGMIGLGLLGTYNAVSGFGKAPVEKTDMTTTGTVTHLTATELRHAVGVTLNTTYSMNYSFPAADGKTYTGEHNNLDEAKFNSLAEGDEITVKYHSNQPSINGAPAYGTYIPVGTFKSAPPQTRMYGCLGIAALGVLVVVYAVKFFDEQPQGSYAMSA